MTKVAAVDTGSAPGLERHHQIASAAAKIEHAGSGALEEGREPPHDAGAPVAVYIERKQMVEQVVARSDAAEHAANPTRRLLLAQDALRCGSAHPAASAASMAASTCSGSTSAVM